MKIEEEARKCWCPFARLTGTDNQDSGNRLGKEWGSVFCIASECMAWRWIIDDGMINEAGHGRTSAPEYGYCGLAGKPEA